MKMHRAENFSRSANAPAISAGVMMANVIWNIMKTLSGTVCGTAASVPAPSTKALSQVASKPFRKNRLRSPI